MFRFKACQKCGGDLMLDGTEWLCCQCGRCYYLKQMLLGAEGRPPSLGRRYEELPSPAGAGRAVAAVPVGAAGPF